MSEDEKDKAPAKAPAQEDKPAPVVVGLKTGSISAKRGK